MGSSKYEATMKLWGCKIIYNFLEFFPKTVITDGKVAHINSILKAGPVFTIIEGGQTVLALDLASLTDKFSITPEEVDTIGNWCNLCYCAYVHAHNAYFRNQSGRHRKLDYSLPSSCGLLCRTKHLQPWVEKTINHNGNPPFVRLCNIADILKTNQGDRLALIKAAENVCSWGAQIVVDYGFQQKSRGEKFVELDKRACMTAEYPHWSPIGVYPPHVYHSDFTIFQQALKDFSALSQLNTYRVLSFMGILNCDLGLLVRVAPRIMRQFSIFDHFTNLNEEIRKTNPEAEWTANPTAVPGSTLDFFPIIEEIGGKVKVFGQRVGAGKARIPVVTQSNLESIQAGYNTRFTMSKEAKAIINAQTEVKVFAVDLAYPDQPAQVLVFNIRGEYVDSMTGVENRKRKGTAAQSKEKALKRNKINADNITKLKNTKFAKLMMLKIPLAGDKTISLGSLIGNFRNQVRLKKINEWKAFNANNIARYRVAFFTTELFEKTTLDNIWTVFGPDLEVLRLALNATDDDGMDEGTRQERQQEERMRREAEAAETARANRAEAERRADLIRRQQELVASTARAAEIHAASAATLPSGIRDREPHRPSVPLDLPEPTTVSAHMDEPGNSYQNVDVLPTTEEVIEIIGGVGPTAPPQAFGMVQATRPGVLTRSAIRLPSSVDVNQFQNIY